MRIGVLITGEPRYHPAAAQSQLQHLIDPLRQAGHSVDILLSLWTTRMAPGQRPVRGVQTQASDNTPRVRDYNEHATIMRTLRPSITQFAEKPATDVSYLVPRYHAAVTVYGAYCNFLSWWHGAGLIEDFEASHEQTFDVIVRLRLDLRLHSQFQVPDPLDGFYVPRWEGHENAVLFDTSRYCNDQLAVAPRDVMLASLRLHECYTQLLESLPHFHLPEQLLFHYLTHHVGCGFKTFELPYNLQR